jgi:hypothetical protein
MPAPERLLDLGLGLRLIWLSAGVLAGAAVYAMVLLVLGARPGGLARPLQASEKGD